MMRKILVVEDEEMLRDAYLTILSTEPYEVSVAENGQKAYELCCEINFDLILLDLMMPILDGVGFLDKFAQFDQNSLTKIVVMSNLSSGNELVAAMERGVDRNVVKAELSPKQLLAMVRYELEA